MATFAGQYELAARPDDSTVWAVQMLFFRQCAEHVCKNEAAYVMKLYKFIIKVSQNNNCLSSKNRGYFLDIFHRGLIVPAVFHPPSCRRTGRFWGDFAPDFGRKQFISGGGRAAASPARRWRTTPAWTVRERDQRRYNYK